MHSTLVPFEEILEGIKDDTGMTNLSNHLPKIRRLIFRSERDIGFGGTTVLKRITYKVSDCSIITTGQQFKIKLPEDYLFIEEIGMNQLIGFQRANGFSQMLKHIKLLTLPYAETIPNPG